MLPGYFAVRLREMPPTKAFVLTLGLLTGLTALTIDLSLPAVPLLAEALGTGLSQGQQVIGIFMAGMACGQIPAGLLSDRLGRLPVLYGGMLLFTAMAVLVSLADNIELMLAARFVQGFGAASAIVLSRAIVRDISTGTEAAKLMSLMTMIFTAAPVLAPTLGALLIEAFNWRAPFLFITVTGVLAIAATRAALHETHTPNPEGHPIRQLANSFREFFSHRQSIFGLMILIAAPAGFMSIITISSALITGTYGYSLTSYGLIFALAGISILLGSGANRLLVARLSVLQLIKLAVILQAIAGTQLLLIAWLDAAPLWWLWGSVCLFMGSVGILLPNATVLALDPLPRIAGVASSIIGTLNNLVGAAGALAGAWLYDGSVRGSVTIIAAVTVLIALVYLAKPLICPHAAITHREGLARR